jgi:hypothetical protein
MSTNFECHGRIKGGLVVTPVFDQSLADYVEILELSVVWQGPVDADLAASWGCPASAGKRMAVLQPKSGAACFIRLVEGTAVPAYTPLRSYGWASLEITVSDVWKLHERILANGAFKVIGEPKLVEGFTAFIPFQVIGRAGEVLYLNQVLENMATLDLPKANAWVDTIFITILAAPDRQKAVDFYRDQIGYGEGDTYTITYTVINNAFGYGPDFKTAMTMTYVDRIPGCEIDQYPDATVERPCAAGELPPGVSLVTYAVQSLDAVKAPFLAPPVRRDGPLYAGRRVATVRGAAGEYLELLEVGG